VKVLAAWHAPAPVCAPGLWKQDRESFLGEMMIVRQDFGKAKRSQGDHRATVSYTPSNTAGGGIDGYSERRGEPYRCWSTSAAPPGGNLAISSIGSQCGEPLPDRWASRLHGDANSLVFLERQRLFRLEHAVFVDGFNGQGHNCGSLADKMSEHCV
jgi:hypothetical protein